MPFTLDDFDDQSRPYVEVALENAGLTVSDDTEVSDDIFEDAQVLADDSAEAQDTADVDNEVDAFPDLDPGLREFGDYLVSKQVEANLDAADDRDEVARLDNIDRLMSSKNPDDIEKGVELRTEDAIDACRERMIQAGMLNADGFENEHYASALESGATAQDDEDHDPDADDGTSIYDRHPVAERNAAAKIAAMEQADPEAPEAFDE